MALVDQLDEMLAQYNRVDERVFIGNIADFGKKYKDIVLATFSVVLKQENLGLQLKNLILKSIGELKHREFAPLVQGVLKNEDKIQLVYSALDALTRINTIAAYKIIVQYSADGRLADMATARLNENLKDLFDRNPLIYHFDLFYRDKGLTKGLEKSSQYLIRHLPDEHVRELLPRLSSHFYAIRLGVLNILCHRPSPIYCASLFACLKNGASKMDETLFLSLSEALVANSRLSRASARLFATLKQHLEHLEGARKKVLSIALLKMNTPEMIPEVSSVYGDLSFQQKELMFRNLNREDAPHYLPFIRELLTAEFHEELLLHVLELIAASRDFSFFFGILNGEKRMRRELLLEMMMDIDPPGLEEYLKPLIAADEPSRILELSLQYLLRHAADSCFELIRGVFFSGAPNEAKTLIIRHLNRFSASSRKIFIQLIFDDLRVVRHFKKDFLYSLVGILNERTFDKRLEQRILDQILVLMEESPFDEMVHFVYFFEKLQLRDKKLMELVTEELRLMQNTILKSSNRDELVRLIHMLIRNMEKRFLLKDAPAAKATEKKK